MKITTIGTITLSGTAEVTIKKIRKANNKIPMLDKTISKEGDRETHFPMEETFDDTKEETFNINLNGIKAEITGETNADATGEEVIKHIWTAVSNAIGGIINELKGNK